ncbi:MAG TPA: DUF429 domain-containing protein [Acidimicrobiales bacterium]|nr:DUF429 domain-containing protein [Acidimicrobiales bacterium]
MRTAGVDLASQAKLTGACTIAWAEGRAAVDELWVGVDDERITELAATVDKLGLDVPLGWPKAFVDAVAGHAADGTWPAGYFHADNQAFRYRRTDIWVRDQPDGRRPLSVSSDRIALPAMRAAAVVARLHPRPPLDGSGRVVEAYPAASLHRWGLVHQGYKGAEGRHVRRRLVEELVDRTAGWLTVPPARVRHMVESDHALDAVVAALTARAAAVGLVEPIPPPDAGAARREGWIALPTAGSLDRLARPADG